MIIILGAFGYSSFDKLKFGTDALEYIDWDSNPVDENYKPELLVPNQYMLKYFIWRIITYYMNKSDAIVFDITHIKLPFSSGVITLKEMWIVMHNDAIFAKTTFYVDGTEINKEILKDLFIKNEPIQFIELKKLFDAK